MGGTAHKREMMGPEWDHGYTRRITKHGQNQAEILDDPCSSASNILGMSLELADGGGPSAPSVPSPLVHFGSIAISPWSAVSSLHES
jgi:hypothetical protein